MTIPNALSALRLFGVPSFLILILDGSHDGWAIFLLFVAGLTDFLDGYIARRFNQQSRLGELLDPLADRLYILATLIGLTYREIIPVFLIVTLVARDLILAIQIAWLRRKGFPPIPVIFLGKAATMNLLYAFPLLLWASGVEITWLTGGAWAFAIWGSTLYVITGLLYLIHGFKVGGSRAS